MSRFLEHYTAWITPLSPIHIGTGEDYEPTNIAVHDDVLVVFDPLRLPFTQSLRNRLLQSATRDDPLAALASVHLFFVKSFSPQILAKVADYRVPIVTDFTNKYLAATKNWEDALKGGEKINANEIKTVRVAKMVRDPLTHRPYLPGSSVKGALRGLFLRMEARKQGRKIVYQTKPRKEVTEKFRALQNELLMLDEREHYAWDPLRLLPIADFHPASWQGDGLSQVVFEVRMYRRPLSLKNDPKKKKKPDILYPPPGIEVILPSVPRVFAGAIGRRELAGRQVPGPRKESPAREIVAPDLAALGREANGLAKRILNGEKHYLHANKYFDQEWFVDALTLLERVAATDSGHAADHLSFFLRIGHGSSARYLSLGEPVTKTISVAGLSQKPKQSALPFGWVLVELAPAGEKPPPNPELEKFCARWREWVGRGVATGSTNGMSGPSPSRPKKTESCMPSTAVDLDIPIPETTNRHLIKALRDQVTKFPDKPEKYQQMLEGLTKQALNWTPEEKAALVAIVDRLIRPRLGNRASHFKWRQLLDRIDKLRPQR